MTVHRGDADFVGRAVAAKTWTKYAPADAVHDQQPTPACVPPPAPRPRKRVEPLCGRPRTIWTATAALLAPIVPVRRPARDGAALHDGSSASAYEDGMKALATGQRGRIARSQKRTADGSRAIAAAVPRRWRRAAAPRGRCRQTTGTPRSASWSIRPQPTTSARHSRPDERARLRSPQCGSMSHRQPIFPRGILLTSASANRAIAPARHAVGCGIERRRSAGCRPHGGAGRSLAGGGLERWWLGPPMPPRLRAWALFRRNSMG